MAQAKIKNPDIAEAINGTNGGTGVSNTGKTFTMGGNVTFSGAFTFSATVTAATAVTFPINGTLATLAGTETLTNKDLTSGTNTFPTFNQNTTGTAANVTGIVAPANGGTGVANSSTITVAGNITHAGAFTQTFTATATTSLTLPTSGTLATTTGTETFQNKRITLRTTTTASTSTLTVNSDSTDIYTVTAQAANITIANPTGTPTQGQELIIRLKDNGTARTIAWGAQFRNVGQGVITSTIVSQTLYVSAKWNASDTTWDITEVSNQSIVPVDTTSTQALTNKSVNGVTLSAAGTATTFLNGNGAYTAPTGRILQRVVSQFSALATGTTAIPVDDTIPQITEGDQYMTVTITPGNTANRLLIRGNIFLGSGSANNFITIALFQDATANALAAFGASIQPNGYYGSFPFDFEMAAGTTSATTFRIRAGTTGGATLTFNGNSSARLFGAINKSLMMVEEYA